MASSPRKRTELPTANVIVALGPCARSGMPACIQHGKHGDAPCCCCMYVCCMTHACMLICVCVPMGIHVRYVRYARTHGHSCTLHTHARTHARTHLGQIRDDHKVSTADGELVCDTPSSKSNCQLHRVRSGRRLQHSGPYETSRHGYAP